MADVTFTIPTPVVARVLDGFAKAHSYQETLPDGDPNPETKAEFAKRKVMEFVKESVKAAEAIEAAEVAREAAIASTETDVILS